MNTLTITMEKVIVSVKLDNVDVFVALIAPSGREILFAPFTRLISHYDYVMLSNEGYEFDDDYCLLCFIFDLEAAKIATWLSKNGWLNGFEKRVKLSKLLNLTELGAMALIIIKHISPKKYARLIEKHCILHSKKPLLLALPHVDINTHTKNKMTLARRIMDGTEATFKILIDYGIDFTLLNGQQSPNSSLEWSINHNIFVDIRAIKYAFDRRDGIIAALEGAILGELAQLVASFCLTEGNVLEDLIMGAGPTWDKCAAYEAAKAARA